MKRVILSTIKREKIYNKNFKADSRVLMQSEGETEEIEKFYEPISEILTLLYKDKIRRDTYDTDENSSSL